ncbi:MAG TPA: alcohol dehydrogenase catalytic domain-containing protein [Longimicrobiales bacterium]
MTGGGAPARRRMLAAVLVEPGRIELREAPVPAPGPGELLVRVDAALTCGTDLKTYRRGHPRIPLPTPMGHEFSGTVAAVGAGVARFREGDAIACVPTAPCGACRLCRRGRENLCPDAVGRMVFGAFAEYVLLPRHIVERHVFPRPDALSADEAAALEPLACVVHGADRVALDRAEHVVFLGDGPITLLFLQVARLRGAGSVIVVGRHEARLEVARALGAETILDPGATERESGDGARDRDDGVRHRGAGASDPRRAAPRAAGDGARDRGAAALREAVLERTGGVGADIVVECVGRPEVWEAAPALAAVGGEVLLYGGCAAGTRASFDTLRVHYEEVDLKGAFHYRPADVREAYALLADRRVAAGPLITHRRPLDHLEEALALVLRREAVKVAVAPEAEGTPDALGTPEAAGG